MRFVGFVITASLNDREVLVNGTVVVFWPSNPGAVILVLGQAKWKKRLMFRRVIIIVFLCLGKEN